MATSDDSESNEDGGNTRYAVGLDHLFWIEADDEEEAIAECARRIADLDEDDVRDLDRSVVDHIEFEE